MRQPPLAVPDHGCAPCSGASTVRWGFSCPQRGLWEHCTRHRVLGLQLFLCPFQLVGGWFADRFGARRTRHGRRCHLAGGQLRTFEMDRARIARNRDRDHHSAGRIGAAAAPIVAFLITWFSWRFSFVVLGIVSVFWAAMWWWKFHEDPRRHPGITSAELAALPTSDSARQIGSGPVPWRRLAARMRPMMIIYFCQGWTGWLYVTWMPSLFQKNYGLDLKKSSVLYAAMLLSGVIGELLGGVGTTICSAVPGAYRSRARYRSQSAGPSRWRRWCRRYSSTFYCRAGGLHAHVVLHRPGGCAVWAAAIDIAPKLRRLVNRVDERRRCRRRDYIAGCLRLDPDADRELDGAVRRLRRAVAVRRRRNLVDPAGSSDRDGSPHWRLGGGRTVEPCHPVVANRIRDPRFQPTSVLAVSIRSQERPWHRVRLAIKTRPRSRLALREGWCPVSAGRR
jgi:Major Facilitator Superfamily